jgi:uncharacterized protein YjbI with pentapeptide repeats
MAWAVMNALSLTIAQTNSPEKIVRVEWPDQQASFHSLLRRLSTSNWDNPALHCFSYIAAPQAELYGLSLNEMDLRGAQMQGADFLLCSLIGANLSGANLEGCNFERAMLDGTNFEGASLKDANLADARINVDTTTDIRYSADLKRSRTDKKIHFDHTKITAHSLLYADLEYFSKRAEQFEEKRTYYAEGDGGDFFLIRVSEIRKILKQIRRE